MGPGEKIGGVGRLAIESSCSELSVILHDLIANESTSRHESSQHQKLMSQSLLTSGREVISCSRSERCRL